MIVLGIDTSNYTTSIAAFDGASGHNCSRLLEVKPGELGLRQSDALFSHVKQLPRLAELGEKLNLCRVHPHKFRRTLATMAIDKGMPIEQVQQLLGHQSVDTTLQYAMVNQANVKQSHKKYIG